MAGQNAMQTALDYACGAGGDCAPIQASGLCYLPNTLIAHASYAFNSYYQRSNMAPGSCDFSGTATVAVADPSYGSCTYPSSASTAGGTISPGTPSGTTPGTPAGTTPGMPVMTPPTPPFSGLGSGGGGGLGGGGIGNNGGGFGGSTGLGPSLPNGNTMNASFSLLFTTFCVIGFQTFLL
ncbi:Glucan endo-1,3-beta-glucosidase 1 [Acorus calamus]|uniref:Glucan endo-1,3-beta-glucosidase 1 n=1 Tax=Acorus calamus TaxID=4465 RepID=A0AAV9D1R4_ACOCL|nr:Glucan endo-1,3-beta-glucosidase 1 [Acorus calamus]